MNYLSLLQRSLRLVVKSALSQAQELPDEPCSFYISFKTSFPGVKIPSFLLEKYPVFMTIVLQHEFWDLEVFEEHFQVLLSFVGKKHLLKIPFASIVRFEDPDESFALDFLIDEVAEKNLLQSESSDFANEGDNIISLDRFRKKFDNDA